MANSSILGYDLRIHPRHLPPWSLQRRTLYLLQPQVRTPLSLDQALWPSRFASNTYDLEEGLILVSSEFVYFQIVGLFPHLAEIKDLSDPTIADDLVIAVTFEDELKPPHWDNLPQTPNHAKPLDNWRFLGFDVTDDGFISGLSNCGYDDHERPTYQRQWASSLNTHGLFKDLAQAQAFREDACHRVAEHAPFYVFGLYLVEGQL